MDMPEFYELRDLAQRDPEGFELLRSELIEDCIRRCSGPNHHRLRGLQFVINAHRRLQTLESCPFAGVSHETGR